jgi:catechol 2,3-dioxygenase-like lactoylglutathione lyase family enzyme
MLDHIGVNVADLTAARAYYDAIMPLLGFEPFVSNENQFSYQPIGGKPGTRFFVYRAQEEGSYSRHRAGLQHLAFYVRSREAVHVAHDKAKELGSEIIHPPQEFPQYHPSYYATFWHDPHGFMLEAVCHKAYD